MIGSINACITFPFVANILSVVYSLYNDVMEREILRYIIEIVMKRLSSVGSCVN